MEAPPLSTRKPTQDEIKNKSIEFNATSDKGNNFKIIFENQIDNLLIIAKSDSLKANYKNISTLSQIQEVKLFLTYDSIDECLFEIKEGIEKNENKIIEETNTLILTIPLSNKKYNQIIFTLNKYEKTEKEKIQDLLSKEDEKEKEIDLLKKENENLKSRIDKVEKELKEMTDCLLTKKMFNFTRIKSHPCILILLDSKNKGSTYISGFICNECKKKYLPYIPNFWCQKCNYDLCLDCYNSGNFN